MSKDVYQVDEKIFDYDNLNVYERKVINYVKKHGYGAVYAIISDNHLQGFSIDGEVYGDKNDLDGDKLFNKLRKIEDAVFDFENFLASNGKLPRHFSVNHLVNHPRWISVRRQLGFTNELDNEYYIPSCGKEQTVEFWEHFNYFSVGEGTSFFDSVDYDKKISLDEYENDYKFLAFLKEKYYLRDLIDAFVQNYELSFSDKVNADRNTFNAVVMELENYKKMVLNEECYSSYFEEIKGSIYNILSMMSDALLYAVRFKMNSVLNHADFVAIMDTAFTRDNLGVKAVYNKNIGFPTIRFNGERYDYRISGVKNKFESDFSKIGKSGTKVYSKKRPTKSSKKQKKKHKRK